MATTPDGVAGGDLPVHLDDRPHGDRANGGATPVDVVPADGVPGGVAPEFGLVDPATSDSVERVIAGVGGLAERGLWQLPDGDLAVLVQVAEVARRRLLMVQVAAAVEAGRRGLPRRAGFGPARGVKGRDAAALAAWVRSLVNISRADARHVAEVGASLFTDPVAADLAETRAAALSGQITARHVAVIADALTRLSPPLGPSDPATGEPAVDEDTRRDAQRVLAEHAAVLDPVQTRVVAERTVAVLDPDAGERLAKDEDARATLRALSFTPDGSGLVHLRGVLTPTCAGLLATAIDAASAPRPAADGTPDLRTPAMRRHDGLQHVLGQVVAADGLLPSTHGSPYRLVVTVPHATVTSALGARAQTGRGRGPRTALGQPRPAPEPPPRSPDQRSPDQRSPDQRSQKSMHHARHGPESTRPVQPGLLPDGWPLSPLTVQTMACGADVVPVLVDEDHQPLDVGDTQYAFPPRIRTAIITRDRGCTYPGCGAPAPWCDVHHLIKFAAGGPTSSANGALLCGRHHRYVHALDLAGRIVTDNGDNPSGYSHVEWDHRPTSWTATTATGLYRTTGNDGSEHRDGHDQHRPDHPPALTDRRLDQLIRRWQRRASRREADHEPHAA